MGNVTLFMRPTQSQLNYMQRFAHCYEGRPRLFSTTKPHQPQAKPPQRQESKQNAEEETTSDD